MDLSERPTEAVISRVHELHRAISAAQSELLSSLAELETREAWLDDGAHDMAHWVSMQFGMSWWKADRWVASGRASSALPRIASSFTNGELAIDKVVELTPFATPDDEEPLLAWSQDVAPGAI